MTQLTDERLEVRLGAIYVLRDVSVTFADLADPVFELLQVRLRERAFDYGNNAPPIDVQAIVETLKMRISNDRSKSSRRVSSR